MESYLTSLQNTRCKNDFYDLIPLFDLQLKSSGKDAPALQALTKYVPKPGPMERKVTVCVCVCVTVCVLPAVRLDSSSREQHVFLLKQTV